MNQTISAMSLNSKQIQELAFKPEKICPLCHTSFDGTSISAFYLKAKLYVIHYCHYCKNAFFSIYNRKSYSETFSLKDSFPKEFQSETFPKSIEEISPNFINIYNQALQSETNNLFEICGMGYRKALEFLVKDYLIKFYPDDNFDYRSASLSDCINKIPNEKIKSLAVGTAWLGNDECHYLRKHKEYDFQQIKAFIHAIVVFIDSEIQYAKAYELISSNKR